MSKKRPLVNTKALDALAEEFRQKEKERRFFSAAAFAKARPKDAEPEGVIELREAALRSLDDFLNAYTAHGVLPKNAKLILSKRKIRLTWTERKQGGSEQRSIVMPRAKKR